MLAAVTDDSGLVAVHRTFLDRKGRRARDLQHPRRLQIGRAHVRTPVTNAHLVCRLLLEKKKKNSTRDNTNNKSNHGSKTTLKNRNNHSDRVIIERNSKRQ